MNDLEIMKIKWESLKIEESFFKVHHFSTDNYANNNASLKSFYNWCRDRNIRQQNLQTLKRALKTATLVEEGHNIDSAIESAWAEFPLIRN